MLKPVAHISRQCLLCRRLPFDAVQPHLSFRESQTLSGAPCDAFGLAKASCREGPKRLRVASALPISALGLRISFAGIRPTLSAVAQIPSPFQSFGLNTATNKLY